MLLGASSATSIQQFKDAAPETPKCTNANKATTDDQDCSTAGNSAWNTITTSRTAKPKDAQASPYPDHTEHIQLDSEDIVGTGFKGALDFKVTPAVNACTNANKATTDDESCSADGNSAWNTITTSRTAKPKDAMSKPYPGHAEHLQIDSQFDGGSHIDTYPPYVPTNNAYPKIYDARAKTAPAVETQTPPADTAAPQAPGWYKPAWYKSGSSTSFGNLAQFDGGSHIDTYPPYVPTNNAYPKIFDARAKTAPAVETQTPPADTAAPQAPGWYKPAWYKSGSSTSFGNLAQFDGGSHIDTYPPYVPTNNAYPKIFDARAKTAPAVETQTPPADTAAPQAPGWYKPAWYKSGSSTSFGNLL
jgi:hypothetical protein